MAAGGGLLEDAPVERRIELSGVDAIDIHAAHFAVEMLGVPDQDAITVVRRISTGLHDGHVAIERGDGTAFISVP